MQVSDGVFCQKEVGDYRLRGGLARAEGEQEAAADERVVELFLVADDRNSIHLLERKAALFLDLFLGLVQLVTEVQACQSVEAVDQVPCQVGAKMLDPKGERAVLLLKLEQEFVHEALV